ncbi:MAG: GYF domain-containing protein [Deltaproteobacteria bacterium]|nr:GYF domain-containing protein [Deltaproteobacteria bacterium]
MNYGCMSCGAKYSIPDARLQKAGVDGLRVRCSRCRAIMAVSSTMAGSSKSASTSTSSSASSSSAKAKKQDDVFARTGGVSPHVSTQAMVTGVIKNPFANFATPDAVSASGGQQEVSRDVTGIFLPMMANVDDASPLELKAKAKSKATTSALPSGRAARADVFYAAIEGRARGPYAAAEMLMLAQKGKIRASTLLWKPGCGGWKPLRHVVDFDVAMLLDAVRTRKRREREAEALAERRLGIVPVRIERQTVRPLGRQMPALPFDAAFDFDDATAVPQLGPRQEISQPFLWKANGAPAPSSSWRPSGFLMAAGVFVVVVAAGLLTAAAVLPS